MSRALVDSGIEWIGKIPSNWKCTKLGRIEKLINGYSFQSDRYSDSGYFIVRITNVGDGVLNKKDPKYYPNELRDKFESAILEKNDLLMSLTGNVGLVGLVNDEILPAALNQRVGCLRKISDDVVQKYIYYLFQTKQFETEAILNSVGTAQLNMSTNWLKGLRICIPSSEEQKRIADYLDSKCSKIDQVIEDNNKAIELLEEYRKSVISKLVFCGVNKTCSQKKDSIIFGSIPNNWEDINMKAIFNFKKGLSITKENLVENGIPVISYGQIHSKINDGTKVKKELIRYVPDTYLESDQKALTHNGDIIFADTSEDLEGSGNSVFIDTNYPIFAGYHTIIASPKTEITKYFAYLFQTDKWRSQVRSSVYGVKLFSITQKILKGCNILVPSLDEQKEITDYLDRMCSNVDKVIDYRKKIIEKLEEYKKSLIYEVVTGKKEV